MPQPFSSTQILIEKGFIPIIQDFFGAKKDGGGEEILFGWAVIESGHEGTDGGATVSLGLLAYHLPGIIGTGDEFVFVERRRVVIIPLKKSAEFFPAVT